MTVHSFRFVEDGGVVRLFVCVVCRKMLRARVGVLGWPDLPVEECGGPPVYVRNSLSAHAEPCLFPTACAHCCDLVRWMGCTPEGDPSGGFVHVPGSSRWKWKYPQLIVTFDQAWMLLRGEITEIELLRRSRGETDDESQ